MHKKLFACLLAAAMLIGILAGCGSAAPSAAPAEAAESAAEAPAAEETVQAEPAAEAPEAALSAAEEDASSAAEPAEEPEEPVPEGPVAGDKDFDWTTIEPLVEEKATLTMFYTQPPPLAAIMDSPNDTSYLYQTFEDVYNVHIEFDMVSMMDATTTFQLMIASGDYDDIINDALNYYDTADQAYEDGIAVDILDYADCVPSFMGVLEDIPDVKADLLTLDGHVLNFPNLQLPIEEVSDGGFLIRQDWLDKVGMDIPQTYDQMHDVMAAFQSQFGATDPYIMPYQVLSPWGVMAGGYGISATADANNIIVNTETGKVELATISDAYYDYLCMFRDWYNEGLINHDFTSQTMNLPDQTIISNEMAGIWFSDQGYIKTYQDLLAEVNPDATLSLMAQPGKDEARSGYIASTRSVAGSGGFSISESCDDIELAMKWCDIWYNPELTQFINYGYEGETFEYDENGKPVLGGIITNNDLGLPSLRMSNGVFLCTSGGFIYDRHKFDMEYNELQLAAYTEWIAKADDPSTVKTSGLPTGAKMNVAEADTVATAMSDITTHVAEMALKFVTGATELNEQTYAQYVSEIEGMRLQEALDAVQSAYDRYLENIE